MKKTLRLIEESTSKVDLFIEIRDARIPYCSRNPEFDLIIKRSQKEKIIIFNKYDLCDTAKTDKIISDYNSYGLKCFAVSTRTHDDMRKMLGYLKEHYRHKYSQVGLWLMACGCPNVGKSSIINQLRGISDLENKKALAKATAAVCTTRGIGGFRILNNPLMFLMDTPGVMIPSSIPKELGMKMAVLGLIKDQIVDKQTMVRFIMEQCEHDGNDKYWQNFRIDKPSTSTDFLEAIRGKHQLYDYDAAYDRIIMAFREGKLGRVTLDDPITFEG
jgi:ribosome biogenesis GTPase A